MSLQKIQMLGFVSLVLLGSAKAQTSTAPATAPQVAATTVTASGTKVHGTITDPDGELIPGATLKLTPVKGSAVTVKSGGDGTYAISVPPGSYTVLVTMPGFTSFTATLKVPAVASTTFDAKLRVGDTEVINVQSDPVQLSVDPDNNADTEILTGKALEALSDDPDELESELQALAGPSAGPNGGQIYVDGFTGGQLPPKASIREIRINQNPFSAQYDQLGYGRIEIFTKPGTDKLHGSLQLNGTASQFDTGNPLQQAGVYTPPFHTFFIFGNLTGPLGKKASYALGGSHRDIENDSFINANIPVLPGTTTLCPPGTPTCSSDPTMQYDLQQAVFTPQSRTDFTPRLDLALGKNNVLTTRYQFVQNDQINQGIASGLTLASAAYNSTSQSNILQMSDTQNIGTKLINEIHFEYEREHTATTALSTAPTVNLQGAFTSGGYSGQNSTDHQDHIEVQNYTSLQLKKNFIRFGGRLRTTREAQNTDNNTNGSFTYSTLANYNAGAINEFAFTTVLVPKIDFTFADLGMYLETDWKAAKNLSISYGFRYETQNHLPADHHDIAPRASIAYGLGKTKGGSPQFVLRGGFGLFYTRFGQGNILTLQKENGINESIATVSGTTTAPINPTCTPSALATCEALYSSQKASQTTYQAAPDLRTAYIVQFAGGVEHALGKVGTVTVNYLHSQGVHQLATQNINYNYNFAAPGPATATTGPQYQYFSEGVFNQNEVILSARVQTTKNITLFGNYTLNSAHGDTSGAGADITTPGDIAADYGRTSFDVRSRASVFGSISLPKYIQFSPYLQYQSGNPYNITSGTDYYVDTFYNERPYLANGAAANAAGTVKSIAGCGTFAQPGSQPAGSAVVPINYCTGPQLFTFNFRLTKTFGFGGSKNADNARNGGQGGPGAPPAGGLGGGGGAPGGGGGRGGGGGGGGRGGGGGGSSTGQRYNLGFGLSVQNLFNNSDLATPQGTLSSSQFGKSTQLAGGPYTVDSAVRRITLQTSFTF